MSLSHSGEYKLPSPLYRLGGNVALRMAAFVPASIRLRFVSSRSSYQVFTDEIGDEEGISSRKWAALRMPENMGGQTVLDIGCSEGFFCRESAKRGAAVLGIDSNLGRLLYGRFTALMEGLDIRYRLGVFPGDFRGRFDHVLCLSVLHHSLTTKDLWKVLNGQGARGDLERLRDQLKLLRSLTAVGGRCVVELPYEYDDPAAEREVVNFDLFSRELVGAGFTRAFCHGTWDYNEKYREFKDRIIYEALA
jgi:SAM-dependent methyltransferase